MPRFCAACGGQMADNASACPACGKAAGQSTGGGAAAAPAQSSATAFTWSPLMTNRVIALVIDVVPAIVASVIIGFIPGGVFLSPVVMAAYWLARDITGQSPGKMVMKLKVVSKDGSESTNQQRLKRNAALAAPNVIAIVPLLGWLLAIPVSIGVLVLELFFLFTKGERFGDNFAGTKVISTQ